MRQLAHWRDPGGGRDVWVYERDDGGYLVRWHGGELYALKPGEYRSSTKDGAWQVVKELISDGTGWHRLDENGRRISPPRRPLPG